MQIMLLFVAIFSFSSCSWFAGPTKTIPVAEKEAPAPTTPPVLKHTRDPQLLQVVKIGLQGDQVMREAWWVVSGERRMAPRSLFGKLHRAALFALDGRLATKGIFSCDQYVMKQDDPSDSRSKTFYETCVKGQEKRIARWTLLSPMSAKAEFFPENLSEVVGLNASIFSKRLECQISWDSHGILTILRCPNWEQDREGQLIRLTRMEYEKDAGQILRLRGQVLQQLQPVRKIEADVPLEGKIIVTETELSAPEKPVDPKTLSPVRGAGPVRAEYADPTKKELPAGQKAINPDLIQQRKSSVRGEQKVAQPESEISVEDEMRSQGLVPLLGPDGQPMIGTDGEPLWGRPAMGDGLIYVPNEPEEEAPPEPAKQSPEGTRPEPDYEQIPPGR
ncbi:MAG: hypothetical protein KF789_07385 [Bdellovibrionaceae bacterium]|nr:hypothetical protein [Pseudobdellovibrionaceae bacterium]